MRMKSIVLAAGLLAGSLSAPAYAVSVVTTPGSAAAFAAPPAGPGGATNTFNGEGGIAPGFTLTGGSLVTGSTPTSAQPAFSDGSRYLSVAAGGVATLANNAAGYQSVSIFLGSIDTFNTIQLLNSMGGVIASFTGSDFVVPANGNQTIPNTNRRVTFLRSEGDALISGIRFSSQQNSLETDNVVFAVPEPSTWAMMLLGFGLVGMTIRARRRRTKVVFA